jgi:hypothetical protein
MALIDSLKSALAALEPSTTVHVQLGAAGTTYHIAAGELAEALGVGIGFGVAGAMPPEMEIVGKIVPSLVPAQPPPPTTLPTAPPTKQLRVATEGYLRVRQAPSVAAPEIGRINSGEVVDVIDTAPTLADGFRWLPTVDQRGWIAIDFTVPAEPDVGASFASFTASSQAATLAVTETPPTTIALPFVASQRGVGSSAGGWAPTDRELELVRLNRIEVLLICTYEPGQAATAVSRFRNAGVKHFIIRAAHHGAPSADPAEYVRRTEPTLREYAKALGSTQDMLIAVHNEPNIKQEGWGTAWRDGVEFGLWFVQVAAHYRQLFPGAKLGYPALSPGVDVPNLRYAEPRFLNESAPAIAEADWIGVHYYWQRLDGSDINPPVQMWRTVFGNKPLVCTELGPSDHNTVTAEAMRAAFNKFAQIGVPPVAFILNGAGSWKNAAWDENGIVC